MSDDLLRDLGRTSEELADLYAVKQYLYKSGIGPQTYYLERVEGAFIRPSFFIKIVNMNLQPYNGYMNIMVYQMMIQFFTNDYFEAMVTAGQLSNLLGDKRGVIIPKYDFSTDPPEEISVNGINSDGEQVRSKMGIRIPPQDVLAAPFQEDDDSWNVPVTFTARSYRTQEETGTLLENVILSNPDLVPPPLGPEIVTAEVTTNPEGDYNG